MKIPSIFFFIRILPPPTRTLPVQKSSPLINTVQPSPPSPPQLINTSRQLPSLPIRQLPNPSSAYFDLQNEEEEETENFPRSGELFYYQTSTSSSSTSNNSTTSVNSDNENNEEQFQTDQQEDDDDEDNRQNQRLQSDEDDQTSPFEYDA